MVTAFIIIVSEGVTAGSLRASVDYGRNREGIQCAGGVCRYFPEHTGVTVMLSVAI